ncbi:rCG21764, isoform CRA_b [Rattus norvegicus]|uniref:RCG21764, isoform CRA_b n=1 Tax=Rattus norvegicus TaxID=10116 RepID=A6J152_RAT|nr:rCG21764, isoform CRA_b [Rattus norvegicus]
MPPTPTATPGKEPAALALRAGRESLPRGAVRLQNPMCFLPRHGPLSEPMVPIPEPLALNPTTESKIFHLAAPGAGDPKQMPSVDIRPHGLKGSQGKLLPQNLKVGEWRLHIPQSATLAPTTGKAMKRSLEGIKTFFSLLPNLFFLPPLTIFFWCVVQQYNFSLIYSIGRYCLYNVQWFSFQKIKKKVLIISLAA